MTYETEPPGLQGTSPTATSRRSCAPRSPGDKAIDERPPAASPCEAGVHLLPIRINSWTRARASTPGQPSLVARVNEIIRGLHADGTLRPSRSSTSVPTTPSGRRLRPGLPSDRSCRRGAHPGAVEPEPARPPGRVFPAALELTVAVVGVVVYARATDDLTQSVFERLNAVAEVKADSLDRWIDEQRRNVVFVGSIPGVGDAGPDLPRRIHPPEERDAAREVAGEDPQRRRAADRPTPRNS